MTHFFKSLFFMAVVFISSSSHALPGAVKLPPVKNIVSDHIRDVVKPNVSLEDRAPEFPAYLPDWIKDLFESAECRRLQSARSLSSKFKWLDDRFGDRFSDLLNQKCPVFLGDVLPDRSNADVAFDTDLQRYLVVWEEVGAAPNQFDILGQLFDVDGNSINAPFAISNLNRPTEGCFDVTVPAALKGLTIPTNCPRSVNPSVAYNNNDNQFMVAWELQGLAEFAKNTDGSENNDGKNFSNIITTILDSTTFIPLIGWDQGIMVSQTFVAYNVLQTTHKDAEVQAWARSEKPEVASRTTGSGFVVTWQTNRDFIICEESEDRDSSSVYARYVDGTFLTGGNKPLIRVFTDKSLGGKPDTAQNSVCESVSKGQVQKAGKPRIAFNGTKNDFVIAFEHSLAGNASLGDISAKKVTFDGNNNATVVGNAVNFDQALVVGTAPAANPDLSSFNQDVALVFDDGNNITLRTLTTANDADGFGALGQEVNIDLGGVGPATLPGIGGSLGADGAGTSALERLLVTYEQDDFLRAVVIDNTFAITRGPIDVQIANTPGQNASIASDFTDFVVASSGDQGGQQIFVEKVLAFDNPPDAPVLDAEPADGSTFAPTRLFLSWQPALDQEDGANVVYDISFVEDLNGNGVIDEAGALYRRGVVATNFVIQASTDDRPEFNADDPNNPIGGDSAAGLGLLPNKSYVWEICTRDSAGNSTCSGSRRVQTDDSVAAWWRFDADAVGVDCPNANPGETVCDFSGKGNDGAPNGGIAFLPPQADLLKGAFDFDGTDDHVVVQSDPSLDMTSAITVEAVLTPAGGTGTIVARDQGGGSNTGNYTLFLDSTAGIVRFQFLDVAAGIPDRTYETNATPLTAGTKGLLTFRHTFGDLLSTETLVDGNSQPENGGTGWLVGGDELPAIGNNVMGVGASSVDIGGADFFNGILDEVIVYNKSLNSVEVANGVATRP